MNQFNKEIAQALLENTNLTEVFRNQLESTMNSLLESELTAILGYDPYVRFNNGNYHNGDYTRRQTHSLVKSMSVSLGTEKESFINR